MKQDTIELNPIQQLFIEGSEHASCIEKTADDILAFPRFMWKESYGNFDENCNNCFYCGITRMNSGYAGSALALPVILGIPINILLNICATPFLLIGGILKGCVLVTDGSAQEHNKMRQSEIAQIPIKEKMNEFKQHIDNIKIQINRIDTEIQNNNNRTDSYTEKISLLTNVNITSENKESILLTNDLVNRYKTDYGTNVKKLNNDTATLLDEKKNFEYTLTLLNETYTTYENMIDEKLK